MIRVPGWTPDAPEFKKSTVAVASGALTITSSMPAAQERHGAERSVFKNLGPVIAGRGVGQISGYVDNLLASLLPTRFDWPLFGLALALMGVALADQLLPLRRR